MQGTVSLPALGNAGTVGSSYCRLMTAFWLALVNTGFRVMKSVSDNFLVFPD